MRKLLIGTLLTLACLALAIWYAASPSVKGPLFPESSIVHFEWGASIPLEKKPDKIKVLTYNIGYASGRKNNLSVHLTRPEVEANLEAMATALKKIDADVVALQEVDFQSARSFDINQFTYLAKALQMPYGAYVLTWNKNYVAWPYWPPQYHFGRIVSGQAVLSRYPIVGQDFIVMEKPKSNPFWYNWFYLNRIVQKVSLTIGDEPLKLWNVHLEAFDAKSRLQQIERVANWVKADDTQYRMVIGDFNSVSVYSPDAAKDPREKLEDKGEALQKLSEVTGFHNAELNPTFLTMPSWAPVKKIDHVFYPATMNLVATGTAPGLVASDHLPVWAILSL
jgi:endonuclease/exonuclease/phosphatase family metal-dependent hydrolase